MYHKMSDFYSKELIEACKPYENVKFEEEEWEEEVGKGSMQKARIDMEDIKDVAKFLGEARTKELKDYLLQAIENDIDEGIKNSYNYVIPTEEISDMMHEIWDECRDQLMRKYKKKLKGVLEQQIEELLNNYKPEKK